ncbi:hypothetical protein SBDP1_1020006 [Syntrophobacter sp. SbD1]|nr:hypothetical protein SBDP1_1020006 [Syntrophobacter sp. SbD1]
MGKSFLDRINRIYRIKKNRKLVLVPQAFSLNPLNPVSPVKAFCFSSTLKRQADGI